MEHGMNPKRRWSRSGTGALSGALIVALAGCGSSSKTTTIAPPPPDPSQLYFSPTMGDVYASTYAIDNTANTFVRTVYGFDGSPANGGTVTDSGVVSTLPNGIVSLGIEYNENVSGVKTTYNPPLTGSWAVELPGQAALIGMTDYSSFTPAVPTGACPSLTIATTFQFVTIPNRFSPNEASVAANNWSPSLETAFGSVEVKTTGAAVNFSNVSQKTLPTNGAPAGAPANPGPASVSAVCAPTFYGSTIGVPGSVIVINPGSNQSVPPTATVGIGPSGFLVEDAGFSQVQGQPYENVLGAGYGAIGLPKPSAALDTPTVAAAQYQGFLYGSGGPVNTTQSGPGFSRIASFGYTDLTASCPSLPTPSTGTVLYGGEFAGNDPSSHASGNCDLAIDLGTQDSGSSGLYPAATVYVTAGFPNNGIDKPYTFPAVAVAGQIDGKYAIFLIGADTTGLPMQAWGIYLLQSH